MSGKQKKPIFRLLLHCALITITFLQLSPLILVLFNSLRDEKSIQNNPLGFPSLANYTNYTGAWRLGNYSRAYLNSTFIGVLTVVLLCMLIGLAAYAMVKLDIYFREFFMGYFVIVMTIPVFAYIVPLYFMFTKLNLVNNLFSIIIICTATSMPFNLLLLRAFLVGIPKELEEAARIDGCTQLQSLWYVIVPLAKPILATVSLLAFVGTWNNFLFTNTFLQKDAVRTVAVKFYVFVGRYSSDLSKIYSAAMISIIPIVIIYLLLQKSFIEGIAQGGLKG